MKKELQQEYMTKINEIKNQKIEGFCEIFFCVLEKNIETTISYDKSKKIIKDYIDSLKEEILLLDYLNKNLEVINNEELDIILIELDKKYKENLTYLYGFIDDNETDFKFFLDYLSFEPITRTDKYRKMTICAALQIENIKEYLDIDDKTWNYLLSNTEITEDENLFGVKINIVNEIVCNLKIFVPPIKNLKTAKINVNAFTQALDIYNALGREYLEIDYKKIAKDNENLFEEKYVKGKIKQSFDII